MTIDQALLIVQNNQHLKGMNYKGAIIDDILVLPTDPQLRDEYMKLYMRTLNADYVNNSLQNNIDVNVVVICNRGMINARGIILQSNIDSLPDDFNVKK